MSEGVTLVSGAVLSDADFAISGGTLGDVSAPPVLLDARTVQLTLGTGASIQPGTTTIAFGTGNDAVRDTSGRLARDGAPVPTRTGDGGAPTVQPITLNAIDRALNGTGTAGGKLQVPRSGFTIDVTWFDLPSGIAPALTLIAATVPVVVDGMSRPAWSNLADAFTRSDIGNTSSFLVRSGVQFPAGQVTVELFGVDGSGMPGPSRSFAFQVTRGGDGIRPPARAQACSLSVVRDA